MGLRITLKPQERIIIGGAVITNGMQSCELIIETQVPILRQKEILSEKDADTPCKRIYFSIQLMYVDEKNLAIHHRTYWKMVQDVIKAAPSTLERIDTISHQILSGNYYQALRHAKELIAYEEELLSRVQ